MRKEIMSIKKQMLFSRIINGIAWIVAGVFNMFDNITCSIISSTAMIVSIYVTISVLKAEKEDDDEMSLQHLLEAKAATQVIIHLVLAILAVILLLSTKVPFMIEINWKSLLVPIVFILLGANDLLVGLTFKRLEEE